MLNRLVFNGNIFYTIANTNKMCMKEFRGALQTVDNYRELICSIFFDNSVIFKKEFCFKNVLSILRNMFPAN